MAKSKISCQCLFFAAIMDILNFACDVISVPLPGNIENFLYNQLISENIEGVVFHEIFLKKFSNFGPLCDVINTKIGQKGSQIHKSATNAFEYLQTSFKNWPKWSKFTNIQQTNKFDLKTWKLPSTLISGRRIHF